MCNNRLGPKFPSVICTLHELRVLDLQGLFARVTLVFNPSPANHLEEIDPQVSNLRKLNTVKLDTNSLSQFPTPFSMLPNMNSLSLSYNALTTVTQDDLKVCVVLSGKALNLVLAIVLITHMGF